VLEGRNVVVHAIPPEDVTAGPEGGLLGWHPRTGEEIWLTTPAVLGHVEDFGMWAAYPLARQHPAPAEGSRQRPAHARVGRIAAVRTTLSV